MDAPPPQENVGNFHHVAELLREIDLSAPRDPWPSTRKTGFLLLEDFGDRTFTRALAEGADEDELYRLAVDALIALRLALAGNRKQAGLPVYDEAEFLLREVALLVDWYLPAITGKETPAAAARVLSPGLAGEVIPTMLAVPHGLVLRDYHVDNLIILEGRWRRGALRAARYPGRGLRSGKLRPCLAAGGRAPRCAARALARDMLARYCAAFDAFDPMMRPSPPLTPPWAPSATPRSSASSPVSAVATANPNTCSIFRRVWRLLEGDLRHPALAPLERLVRARDVRRTCGTVPKENETQ